MGRDTAVITIDLSDPIGWERLALLHDVLDAHAAHMIQFSSHRARFHPDLPNRMITMLRQHPDVLDYVRDVRLAEREAS